MRKHEGRLRKILNKFVLCLLIGVMFVFTGCEFSGGGGSNSIGSGGNNGSDPTPPQNNRPPATVEIDPDPSENSGYGGDYKDMSGYLDGVRMVFKKDAKTIENMAYIKEELREEIDLLSVEILKGLVWEYGPNVQMNEVEKAALDALGVVYTDTNPFSKMDYADWGFTLGGSSATSAETLQLDEEMQKIVDVIQHDNTTYILDGHDGVTHGLDITIVNGGIELERTMGWDVVSIENLYNGDSFPAQLADVNGWLGEASISPLDTGAYRFEFRDPVTDRNFVSFVVVGYSDFAIDTHADAIREDSWNWSDVLQDNNLEDDRVLQTMIDGYQNKLKADILKIMLFGEDDIPEGSIVVRLNVMPPEGTVIWTPQYVEETFNPLEDYTDIINDENLAEAMDNFLDFASIYLDHWGLSSGEADALAEYVMSEIIGSDIISSDDSKILPNGTTDSGTITYNTNEAIFDGNTVIKYRKLIEGYSAIDIRSGGEAGGYNDVFSKIQFAAAAEDVYGDSGFVMYNGKHDISANFFKNYRTTVYSVMHRIRLNGTAVEVDDWTEEDRDIFKSRGILEYLDVAESYINGPQGILGVELEDYESDENYELNEGFGEFDINPDPYITGRMQSIILMPNTAFNLSYLGLGIMPTTKPVTYPQPQYSYLEPIAYDSSAWWGDEGVFGSGADKLKISTVFRYHKWDESTDATTIYECMAPAAEMFVTIDEWGTSPGDIWEAEFDITAMQFVSPEGELLDNGDLDVTLDPFAGPGAILQSEDENSYSMYSQNYGILSELLGLGRKSVQNSEFDSGYHENQYNTSTRPSYVSNYGGFSYFEVAFSAELNGRPYDFMYGLQILITQICGNEL